MPISIDLDSYCKHNNLTIKCDDGQKSIQSSSPFDRIICNLVLMLTEDPWEMMTNFHRQAKEGCLLGVTITGDA